MQKTYLVTGGSGFIGSALVRTLLRDGHRVRSLDNLSRGRASNLTDCLGQVELITGDIRDLNAVKNASRGVDSILHLAAVNGTQNFYSNPELVLEVAVKGMLNVLDACKENGISELITMSTSEVYQNPPTVPTPETVPLIIPDALNARYSYAAGKQVSEMLTLHAQTKGITRAMIVRPHNVYGPSMGWEHVVPELFQKMWDYSEGLKQKTISIPIQGTGKETRSFVFIDDMISGFLAVLKNGRHKEIYHVGTEQEISIATLIEEMAKALKLNCTLKPGTLTQGSTPRRCPNIAKVRALGYEPQVSLSQGLKKTLDWYQNHIHLRPIREQAPWPSPNASPQALNPAS